MAITLYTAFALGFSSSERQFHHFIFQAPQQRTGPTTLKIAWYEDRNTIGHCVWKAEVIKLIPNADNPLPESCINAGRCSAWPLGAPEYETTLPLEIPEHDWLYSLCIYRDATNPLDTAAAWAMITDLQIVWEDSQYTEASTS